MSSKSDLRLNLGSKVKILINIKVQQEWLYSWSVYIIQKISNKIQLIVQIKVIFGGFIVWREIPSFLIIMIYMLIFCVDQKDIGAGCIES